MLTKPNRQILLANALFLVASINIVFGLFIFINLLNIQYYSILNSLRGNTIHIVLVSQLFDRIIVFGLSSLTLLFSLLFRRLKQCFKWMIFICLLLILALAAYAIDIIFIGDISLVLIILTTSVFFIKSVHSFFILRIRTVIAKLAILVVSIFLVFESLSLMHWIIYPFIAPVSDENFLSLFVDIETQIFYVPAILSSFILVLVLFSWIIRPVRVLQKYVKKIRIKIGKRIIEFNEAFLSPLQVAHNKRRAWLEFLILFFSLSLSFFYALYPYLPSLNPTGKFVGVDIPWYVRWLSLMSEKNGLNAFSFAFSNMSDRPLSLFLMYNVWKISGESVWTIVQFLPLILGPLLVLSVYFFVLQSGESYFIPSFVALFTASSYPITVGMYAGFLSNWMCLIGVFLFSGLFLKSLQKSSWIWWLLTLLASLSLLFLHAYTWSVLMGVLVVYFLILLFRGILRKNWTSELKFVVVLIALNFLADLAKNYALGSLGLGREVASVASSPYWLSLSFFSEFWLTVNVTFLHEMNGSFLNPIMLFLALIGAFSVILKDRPFHRLLVSWLIASSFPFVFGSKFMQARLLYDLPIFVFAFLGFDFSLKFISHKLDNSYEARILQLVFALFIILVFVNYGFRCMSVLPQFPFSPTPWEN